MIPERSIRVFTLGSPFPMDETWFHHVRCFHVFRSRVFVSVPGIKTVWLQVETPLANLWPKSGEIYYAMLWCWRTSWSLVGSSASEAYREGETKTSQRPLPFVPQSINRMLTAGARTMNGLRGNKFKGKLFVGLGVKKFHFKSHPDNYNHISYLPTYLSSHPNKR